MKVTPPPLISVYNTDTPESFHVRKQLCQLGKDHTSAQRVYPTYPTVHLSRHLYSKDQARLYIALKSGATGIILAHNHPSGNLQPSVADVEITKKIQSACNFLDIKLLDHIIVVPQQTYFSFVDEDLL